MHSISMNLYAFKVWINIDQSRGKTTLHDALALHLQNEAPVGWCVQTWWDLVEEFVYSGQARFHLQIFHSSKLYLPKLQEEHLLCQPALSISNEEASQALLDFLHLRRAGKACKWWANQS